MKLSKIQQDTISSKNYKWWAKSKKKLLHVRRCWIEHKEENNDVTKSTNNKTDNLYPLIKKCLTKHILQQVSAKLLLTLKNMRKKLLKYLRTKLNNTLKKGNSL